MYTRTYFNWLLFFELDVVLVVPRGMVDFFDGSIFIYIHTYRNMFTHFHTIIVGGCFLGFACSAMGDGVATISRHLQFLSLFCERAL